MANPVVLYDVDQRPMNVENGVAIPANTQGILILGSDGTNARNIKVSATGVVSIDGSGATQPVSAATLPLPTGAATSALQTQPGVDIGDVTVNNAAGAAAVNIQDGGNSLTVDGTVTANIGTTNGLALDATLTGGTQKAIVRGGAKGATAAADVTSTVQSADRQGLDVQIRTSAGVAVDGFGGTQFADGTARGTATGTLAMVDDGTNIQSTAGDTSGRQRIVGAAAQGAAVAGDPIMLAGENAAGNVQRLQTTILPPINGDEGLVVRQVVAQTGTSSNVAGSATNVTLLAANTARIGATLFNDSNQNFFVKLGATSSLTSFTVRIETNGYYEVPYGYTGIITGIQNSANGNMRITELS